MTRRQFILNYEFKQYYKTEYDWDVDFLKFKQALKAFDSALQLHT